MLSSVTFTYIVDTFIMDTYTMDTTIRINDTCIMDTYAWVTRPVRPKSAKDEVKQAQRVQSRPEGLPARSCKTSILEYCMSNGFIDVNG